MSVLIFAYALGVALVSLALIFDSGRMIELGFRYCQWRYMHIVEIGLNGFFGAVFFLNAGSMKFTTVFTVYGALLFVIGLGLAFLPPRLHRRYGLWSIRKFGRALRPAAFGSLAFAAFVAYAAL